MPPGWKWIISFYGKVVTIIMYFIVTTYRNKTGNVCCDCVRYYRNDLCWIRVRIVTLNGNKIRWRSYVTYATKLQNDLWLTIVTKIQLYKIVVVIIMYWYRAVREQCSLTALYHIWAHARKPESKQLGWEIPKSEAKTSDIDNLAFLACI